MDALGKTEIDCSYLANLSYLASYDRSTATRGYNNRGMSMIPTWRT